jgi:predicted regulator of Ras-like GTPase activity (Roadblock/LC7/MglB family)
VDAAQALADLVEISSQIESAVLADTEGAVQASTFGDDAKASAVAKEAIGLLRDATGPGGEPSQVEIAFLEGSVFVVRDDERVVAAVTGREPTSGLVFYDLKTCLRLAGEQPARTKAAAGTKRRAKKKDEPEDDDGEG